MSKSQLGIYVYSQIGGSPKSLKNRGEKTTTCKGWLSQISMYASTVDLVFIKFSYKFGFSSSKKL